MSEHEKNQSGGDDSLNFPARVRLDALEVRDFDGAVRSIVAGTNAERARIAAGGPKVGALAAIAQWSSPAFAAAAVVLIAATVALVLLPTPAVAAPASFAETAGISTTLVQWSSNNHSPTPDELLGAITAAHTQSAP